MNEGHEEGLHYGTPGWRTPLALLWIGQIVSHLGDSLFFVGIFFLALEVTGSKGGSGLLVALNFLPALALGLFAGTLVDRHDRRQLMIAADLLRAAAVAAIPLLHHLGRLGPGALAAVVFLLATGTTLFNPAVKALVPELVPASRLTQVAALFQVTEFGALVVGPWLAAAVIQRFGTIHLFTADAVSFVGSACCLALLRAAPPRRRTGARSALASEMREGLRTVLASPLLRGLLLLVALDNLVLMGLAHVATPLLVKETLGLGPAAYAGSQRAFFAGMAAASALYWILGRRAPAGPTILTGLLLDAITFVPLAFCRTMLQVEVAMFVHGLAVPLIIIPRTVLLQRTVPGPLHGRSFALLNATVFGMMAVSSGLTGLLAERFAPSSLFLALGVCGTLIALAGFLCSPLRRAR